MDKISGGFHHPETGKQEMVLPLHESGGRKTRLGRKEEYDVMDLRGTEGQIESIDNIRFFPGYHMNKKHWYTIILNETMSDEEIKTLIEESYNLAK